MLGHPVVRSLNSTHVGFELGIFQRCWNIVKTMYYKICCPYFFGWCSCMLGIKYTHANTHSIKTDVIAESNTFQKQTRPWPDHMFWIIYIYINVESTIGRFVSNCIEIMVKIPNCRDETDEAFYWTVAFWKEKAKTWTSYNILTDLQNIFLFFNWNHCRCKAVAGPAVLALRRMRNRMSSLAEARRVRDSLGGWGV